MAEKEVEVLAHLLEVEQKAANLTMDAQVEADKRIIVAKAKADSQFKDAFSKIVSENEANYEKVTLDLSQKTDIFVKNFKDKISSSAKSIDEFNSYLDKILFD